MTVSIFKKNKPHFLLSFSVFWDLYCAAPERRDTCEHSSEAKAFHDYVSILFHVWLLKKLGLWYSLSLFTLAFRK